MKTQGQIDALFEELVPRRRRERAALLRRYKGLCSDIGRQMTPPRTRQSVREVFHREKSSAEIREAIVNELLRRQGERKAA